MQPPPPQQIYKFVIPSKRVPRKILPKISEKPLPVHNNSSQHFYKRPIKSEMQLEQWAYVASPDQKQQRSTKYIHCFDQFYTTKSRINLNPENQENTSSLLLLDHYFKRKHSSKLKEIIKVPAKSKGEGVSSIGFQGINFHQNRQRRTLQAFYNTKRSFSSQQVGSPGVAFEVPTPQNIKPIQPLKKISEEGFPSVDFYFLDKHIALVD